MGCLRKDSILLFAWNLLSIKKITSCAISPLLDMKEGSM